jgi:hypothetical protein
MKYLLTQGILLLVTVEIIKAQKEHLSKENKMSKRIIKAVMVISLSFAFIGTLYSQIPSLEWEKTFDFGDGALGNYVSQTSDKGFIIVGETGIDTVEYGDTVVNVDVYLIKTDSLGNMLWQKTFGGSEQDDGEAVQQTNDSGYILVGTTSSFSDTMSSDAYLIKTDRLGNLQWQRTFGGYSNEYGYSVQQTNDGGYILAGQQFSFGPGDGKAWLIKTDTLGNLTWQKSFGDSYVSSASSVQQTKDGGYIVTGYRASTPSSGEGLYDVYLIKTDSSGNLQWQKEIGGYKDEWGISIQQTKDGGFIVTGYTESFGNWVDVYLVKTDSLGNSEWQNNFGGNHIDAGLSVQQTQDLEFIISGSTQSYGNGGTDVYLIKTDSLGNFKWQKTFGDSWTDEGNSVQQTNDDGYIITGMYYDLTVHHGKLYLIKLGPE